MPELATHDRVSVSWLEKQQKHGAAEKTTSEPTIVGFFFPCKMQPSQSQLFESLKVYLNNSRRLQPVIGLDAITECVTAGAMSRERLYFCSVCVSRCCKSDIRSHIFGSHHRFNYIKARHPHLLTTWQEDNDLSAMAWPLMELAKTVEEKEGPGQVQLIEVQEDLYQKMATLSEIEAVILLRGGWGEDVSCTDAPAAPHGPARPPGIVLQNQRRASENSLQPPHQTSCESSEKVSFLDNYAGTKPLIGLLYVDEYRSEDGSSSCFLCHCCCVRSNKKQIIDHLTSSSHLINYMMETHPEQVEELGADSEMLQALALKGKREDSRQSLKVVNVPESLCRQLSSKSYNYCLKILNGDWTHTNIPEKKSAPGEMSGRFKSQRNTATPTSKKRAKTMKSDTVFTVSLPLSGGPLLLERPSFNVEREIGFFTEEEDSSSQEPSQFQPDLHSEGEDVDGCIPKKNLIVTLLQDVDHSPTEDLCYRHREARTETKDHEVPERTISNPQFHQTWQSENDLQAPTHGWTATPYFPSSTHWQPSLTFKTGTFEPRLEEYADRSLGVFQRYDQQQVSYQYAVTGWAASLPASVPYGPQGGFYDPAPHLNAATAHMQPQYGGTFSEPGTRGRLHQPEQGPQQTYQQFDCY